MLRRLFVLAIHRHALARQDVGQGALVSELAVALDEPGACFLCLAGLASAVREWARRTRGASADLVKFARHMRQVLAYNGSEKSLDPMKDALLGADFAFLSSMAVIEQKIKTASTRYFRSHVPIPPLVFFYHALL